MARARQRALTGISLSRLRAGLEWSSRFFANVFLSFAPFSYTRALESLTTVVPRLDSGSASFRPRFIRGATAVKTQTQYTLSLICTVWGAGPRLQNPVMHLANSLEALVNTRAQRGISDLPLLLGCMWSGD